MDIKQYLEKVKELETSLYNQKLTINHIDRKIRELEYDYDETSLMDIDYRNHIPRKEKLKRNVIKEDILEPANLFLGSIFVGGALLLGILLHCLGMKNIILPLILVAIALYMLFTISNMFLMSNYDALEMIFKIGIVVFVILGYYISKNCNFPIIITITILVLIWDIIVIVVVHRKNIKYNMRIEITYKNEMEQFYKIKADVKCSINDLKNFLRDAKFKYNETLNILNKIYAYDIIHPKYRSLIPVCSFYEYFDTGICDCLKGHEGAYRQYEKDIQMNRIITSLDSINDKLDTIIENQNQLYNELKKIENYQNNMCNKIDYLCQTSSKIAEDTAFIKYQNDIIAKNTEILKWISIYEVMYNESAKEYI